MTAACAKRPISEELPKLMKERGWKPIDVYAHGGPTPATVSRYQSAKRGLVAEPRVIGTLRKFEKAFDLPEGYFLEEQIELAQAELQRLAREGFVSLEELEALIEEGRQDKKRAEAGT
jgi:transcriptional regulator with XRE-family HTH domain